MDYSIYEPYGLSYDQENYYFTYNGNVVRFFNDPIAGASFTNFFSGTVDIEGLDIDDLLAEYVLAKGRGKTVMRMRAL